MRKGRHSKDDALSEEDFNRLVKACELTNNPLVDMFLVLVMGVLGLRCGEIAHMRERWVDFKKKIIVIPPYEPCACSYCVQLFENKKKRKHVTKEEVLKDITKEEVSKEYWQPKSEAGARIIPFGFSQEIEWVLKEVMSKYTKCPYTTKNVNLRIKNLGRVAGIDVYPHALRATAATKLAWDGLPSKALQVFGGWEDMRTVEKYIAKSGVLAQKAMEKLYGKSSRRLFDCNPRRVFYQTELAKKLLFRKVPEDEEEWLRRYLNS